MPHWDEPIEAISTVYPNERSLRGEAGDDRGG